jgi:hypothetical protein
MALRVLAYHLIRVRSPSMDPEIQRYAEMANGDTIPLLRTISAYVRGVS